eukprot:TRINITY_DN2704_c0_g1_i1.p1 TRINITY_DN2704_c0_g1~~TRINITY_DN2704_c0_g1_i1.p1  ORF type:complete len:199 (+),score=23.96 TRINITY_DN2704_c0_g1_i1:271-867(+)
MYVLILGIAKLLAGAISMGVGDFLATDAQVDLVKRERKREEWEFDNYPEGEVREMIELYMSKGLDEPSATRLVEILSQKRDAFVDIMMAEELGISIDDAEETPWKHGLVNFTSFMIFGIVPLIVFIIAIAAGASGETTFYIAIGVTALTLCGMGLLKGRLTKTNILLSVLITLGLGALSAVIGWAISFILQKYVGAAE